jgi:hypothetical protein
MRNRVSSKPGLLRRAGAFAPNHPLYLRTTHSDESVLLPSFVPGGATVTTKLPVMFGVCQLNCQVLLELE